MSTRMRQTMFFNTFTREKRKSECRIMCGHLVSLGDGGSCIITRPSVLGIDASTYII